MHEAGIAQAALEQIVKQITLAGGGTATCIALRIGTLSGVDPEALRFAMECILPDSPAQGARLEIEVRTAVARCHACRGEFAPNGARLFECPSCHALGGELIQGRELELVRIDLSNTP